MRRHAEELQRRGCEVTLVGVDQNGDVDLAEAEEAIRPNTAIVSLMWANTDLCESDNDSGSILEFDPAGAFASGLNQSSGLAVDRAGNLSNVAVVAQFNGQVRKRPVAANNLRQKR